MPIFRNKNKTPITLPQPNNRKQKGDAAEQIALDYLIKKGFKCLHKQFRCKMGECDLIMKDNDTIVFVEVRYKKNTHFCKPEETIHWNKQRRLINTAQYFLVKYPNSNCRFDVIAITGIQPKLKITWIPDAFGVE